MNESQFFGDSIPLALYIHIPWCVRKCPYCDFNSHEIRVNIPEDDYVDALLRDLEQDVPRVSGRPIESVFLGGGTPSLFSAGALDRLLSGVRARLSLRPGSEITLEANPGTVEQRKFQEFRAIGINRLSMGVQSFNGEHLRRLGRIHGPREAIQAAQAAHGAGFDNFNLDLMFGLPGQTERQTLDDIATAVALAPTHISYYQLTLEPNTLFHKYPPTLPDDDVIGAMHEQGQKRLAESGYRQYEVSAYSRPGWRSRHNLNYWEFGDYLGIGAGAHGKLTSIEGGVVRLWKSKNPGDYLRWAGSPRSLGGETVVPEADRVLEFMLNALRLTEGFPLALFTTRTGLTQDWLEPGLSRAKARDLAVQDGARLRPTALGQRFLNDLLAFFIPPD